MTPKIIIKYKGKHSEKYSFTEISTMCGGKWYHIYFCVANRNKIHVCSRRIGDEQKRLAFQTSELRMILIRNQVHATQNLK